MYTSYLEQLQRNTCYPGIGIATRIQLLMAQQGLLFEAATPGLETFNLMGAYEEQVELYLAR